MAAVGKMAAPVRKHKIQRRNPRQKRSKELVSAILQATAQILETRGYRGCSTNLVAQKAGVSIGSLYQYFPDKESLVVAVIEEVFELNRTTFDSLAMTTSPDSARPVNPIIDGMVRLFFTKKQLLRVLLDDVPAAVRNQGFKKNRLHFMSFLKSRMAPVKSGESPRNPETTAFIVVHAIVGTLHGTLLDGLVETTPETLASELDLLISGYLNPSRAPA